MRASEAIEIRRRLGMPREVMARILGLTDHELAEIESEKQTFQFHKHEERYRYVEKLGEIALARRKKLDWSL